MNRFFTPLFGLLCLACFGAQALPAASSTARLAGAQGDKPERREKKKPVLDVAALKRRMKARYATLARLREQGLVGETWNGFVDVVKKSAASRLVDPKDKSKGTVAQLLAKEVADRRLLYAHLARQLKTRPETIGVQSGVRHLARAKPEHWFRLKDGRWAQRKRIRRKKGA